MGSCYSNSPSLTCVPGPADFTNVLAVDSGGDNFNSPGSWVIGPPSAAVPEPSSLMLLGTGALGCFLPIRKKILLHLKR